MQLLSHQRQWNPRGSGVLRLEVEGLVRGWAPSVSCTAWASSLAVWAGWVEKHPIRWSAWSCRGRKRHSHPFSGAPRSGRPPPQRLDRLESSVGQPLALGQISGFQIRPALPAARVKSTAWCRPDRPPAPTCWRSLVDPFSRRCGYASTSCATAGPRFSILRALPFERRPHVAGPPFSSALPARVNTNTDPPTAAFHAQTRAAPLAALRLAGGRHAEARLSDPTLRRDAQPLPEAR